MQQRKHWLTLLLILGSCAGNIVGNVTSAPQAVSTVNPVSPGAVVAWGELVRIEKGIQDEDQVARYCL